MGDKVVGETSVGELIGEIGVLQRTTRTATVTAKTPMRLLVLSPQELKWLFDDPKAARSGSSRTSTGTSPAAALIDLPPTCAEATSRPGDHVSSRRGRRGVSPASSLSG